MEKKKHGKRKETGKKNRICKCLIWLLCDYCGSHYHKKQCRQDQKGKKQRVKWSNVFRKKVLSCVFTCTPLCVLGMESRYWGAVYGPLPPSGTDEESRCHQGQTRMPSVFALLLGSLQWKLSTFCICGNWQGITFSLAGSILSILRCKDWKTECMSPI